MLQTIVHTLVWLINQLMAFLHLPIWLYFTLQPPKRCPPVFDDVYFQTASSLAKQIREQKIKSTHVVFMYIKRAEEVNKVCNAIVDTRFELAMKEAQDADDYVAYSGLSLKELEEKYPLLGVPMTIKESVAVEGLSFAAGSKIKPGKALRDAEVVVQLKNYGAIIYAVTTTSELCINWETTNFVTGRTLNPYDTRRSCGGSSGGEVCRKLSTQDVSAALLCKLCLKAVLLATCGSLIGLGTDLVGSGRGPSSFCGIYGHRTSSLMVSTDLNIPDFDDPALTLSPMARYAIDLPLILKCIVKPDKVEDINGLIDDPRKIKVYYMFGNGKNFPMNRVNCQIKDAVQKVANHLEEDGFITKNIQLKTFEDQLDIAIINLISIPNLNTHLSYPNISILWELLRYPLFIPRIVFSVLLYEVANLFYKLLITDERIDRHRRLLAEMKNELDDLLGDDGVLIYPTFPSTALVHAKIYSSTVNATYMMIFNALDLPVLNIPIGIDSNGLPIGVQVVGKSLNDGLPMSLARYLETSYGGWTPPTYLVKK